MGRKLGGAATLFGEGELDVAEVYLTTCMPSLILIHPTVWPQYTNVTDRQTDRQRQRSDSIG